MAIQQCRSCKTTLPVTGRDGRPGEHDVCPFCGAENPVAAPILPILLVIGMAVLLLFAARAFTYG